MVLRRPIVPSGILCAVVALYILVFLNNTLWHNVFDYFDFDYFRISILFLSFYLIYFSVILIFSAQYLIKPALIFLVVVSASAAYFVDTFGVIITPNMIENAVTTTQAESSHLITLKLFIHLFIYALIPSLIIIFVKIKHRPILTKLWVNTLIIISCLIAAVGLLLTDFGAYASMFRQKKAEIVGRLNPLTPIVSAIRYQIRAHEEKNIVAQPLGTDAVQLKPFTGEQKKRLTVLVVGETARAQNFSLNGYARNTNPGLAARDVIAFQDTSSCGTETAVSLPCMFSPFIRTEYSSAKSKRSQNFMDVLNNAGVEVAWYENNTGSKGVADRIEYIELQQEGNPNCSKGECYDQVLVDALRDRIEKIDTNAVIVLHMLGSHGPAYYLRYPPDQEIFKPACRTADFSKCDNEQIINTYDNSIAYTDKVLTEVIDILKSHEDEFASSMIYMSDHGESLGEKGLYLHAMPYFIAPDEQTQIPFIAWFSPDFQKENEITSQCVQGLIEKPFSHDNLFHTILGVMDVKTSVYEKQLDAFASCRKLENS